MHLEYFGLAKPPFAEEPDTDIFFPEADRTALLRRIYAELQNGSPIIRLTGAEGVGKTLLCLLLAHLLPAEFQAVYLASPAGSFDELLRAACQELGQPPQADMSAWLRSQLELLRAQGKKFLLLIDQAENMFPAALERLLRTVFTSEEQGGALQVVFAGRPALNDRIGQLEAYCADMAIPPGHQLAPLTEEELAAFLSFRLKTAGLTAADSGRAFSGEAVRRIHAQAQGSLRIAQLLADQSLQRVCAADRYFPVLAADVPPPEGAAAGKRRKKSAVLSGSTRVLLAVLSVLFFAVLLFRYGGLLRRSGERLVSAAGTPVVTPDELLPVPQKLQLNSEPELPPEPPSEPEAALAQTAEEPAAEPSAAAQTDADEPPLEEESLDTPPPAGPTEEESSPAPEPQPEPEAAPPPAPPQQTKIVQLSPGMRKTRLKPKDAPSPAAPAAPPPPAAVPERAEINADQLYQELLAAGGLLRNSRSASRYTIQLATLAAPEMAKEMIVRDEYLEHRRQLKLLRRPSPASPTFIFYGSYGSFEEAQAAVSQMPLFLRKQHHPSALPVTEALRKVGN